MSQLECQEIEVQDKGMPPMLHRSRQAKIAGSDDSFSKPLPLPLRNLQHYPPVDEILCRNGPSSKARPTARKELSSSIKLKPRKPISEINNRSSCIITPDKHFRRKRPASSMTNAANSILPDFTCNDEKETKSLQVPEKEFDLQIGGLSLHSPVARRPNPLYVGCNGPQSPGPFGRKTPSLPATSASCRLRWFSQSSFSKPHGYRPSKTLKPNVSSTGPLQHEWRNSDDTDEEMAYISTSPGMARFVERARSIESHLSSPSKIAGTIRHSSFSSNTPISVLSPSQDNTRTPLPNIALEPKRMPQRHQESLNCGLTETASLSTCSTALASDAHLQFDASPCLLRSTRSPPPDQVSVSSNNLCPPTPRFGNPEMPSYISVEKKSDNKSFASDVSHLADFFGDNDGFMLITPRRLGLEREGLLCQQDDDVAAEGVLSLFED